ncbi:MAG: hypothetical protein J6X10_03640 [Bacteroidales bacterium]|nr:hypothetical protein [Bacteroidales bacterium]
MKRCLLIVFSMLLLATGCNRKPGVETLSNTLPLFDKVYEVKDHQPDSALKLMQLAASPIDETALRLKSKFLYAEYSLLKAEVNYKNYKPIGNIPEVMEAYRFYDSIYSASRSYRSNEFLAFQYARAAYYKAVVEERREETQEQSFSDYLQSLWITDGLNNKRRVIDLEDDNVAYEHHTGLIYDRLAWFFYNHNAWDLAIECLERSNECFEIEQHLEGIASNYGLMGDIMLAQDDRMASVKYYKESDSIYRMINKENDYLNFNGVLHHAITLSSSGDKEGAKGLLLQALENSRWPWMTRRLHFGLGFVYNDLFEYDSALYHYERSYPLLPRQTAKSYCRIIQLASHLGDTVKVAHYGHLLADLYSEQVQQSGQRTRMMTLYEKHKAASKDARDKDIFYFIVLIIIVLAFVIVIDTAFLHSGKKRHKREIARQERIKASLEDEIESTRRMSKRKEEKIKDLETKLNMIVSNPDFQSLPFDKKMETLLEMPICKRVVTVKNANVKASVAYPEMVLYDNQMSALVNAVDAVFPKFSVKIIEKYPRLKRSDVVYCCLYILGVSEVQAAALMGKTYQAVWTRSLKLHEIFDNKSNLQFVLSDILKNWFSVI